MKKRSPFLLIAVSLAVSCGGVQAAAPTPQELEIARLQLQGMKDSRERLVSGIFRVTGKDCRASKSGSIEQTRPVKLFCAFDYATSRFRCDRDTGEVIVLHHVEPDERDIQEAERLVYIRRPDFSLHYCTEEADVFRRKGDADPNRKVAPFDVRCLGLAFNATLDSYCPFAGVYEACCGQNVIEVAKEGDICRVVSSDRRNRLAFGTIWFNREQGYSPIRIQLCIGTPTSPAINRGETTWQQISGVWVPRTFLGEDYDSGKTLTRKMELAFEWESVNEPVAEKYFTAAGMGLRPETRIISDELGKPIVVGTVGGIDPVPVFRGTGKARTIVLIVSSLVMFAVIVMGAVHRMRVRTRDRASTRSGPTLNQV